MKILIATGIYPPQIGGPATYTKMLEEHLPQNGIDVHVALYGWVRRYPKLFRHLVFTWKLIRESRGCDLIYALDPVSVGLPSYIASKIVRKPYLIRIPGDYAWEQGQQRFGVTDTLDVFVTRRHRYHPVVRLLRSVESYVTKRARGVVVPSEYMKGIVSTWGVPDSKIQVIYSALFPLNVEETKEEIRSMFNYEGLVLVTAGRLVPWKGMRLLISIMPKLRDALSAVSLVIIGDGPMEKELKEYAKEKKVSDHIRFVGRLEKNALGAAVKGADLFVLNTAYEGMSHQILEVMDLGIPIVTTNVGGNPELIEDGKTGRLVPYNDEAEYISAILELLQNPSLASSVAGHAKERTKNFQKEKLIEELSEYLLQVHL